MRACRWRSQSCTGGLTWRSELRSLAALIGCLLPVHAAQECCGSPCPPRLPPLLQRRFSILCHCPSASHLRPDVLCHQCLGGAGGGARPAPPPQARRPRRRVASCTAGPGPARWRRGRGGPRRSPSLVASQQPGHAHVPAQLPAVDCHHKPHPFALGPSQLLDAAGPGSPTFSPLTLTSVFFRELALPLLQSALESERLWRNKWCPCLAQPQDRCLHV